MNCCLNIIFFVTGALFSNPVRNMDSYIYDQEVGRGTEHS